MKVFIATTPRDLRHCRICLASVRHFYPDAQVSLLAGAPLPSSFLREVERYYKVCLLDIAPSDYGWGFVKLEPLFGPPGAPFLMLDADTVMTGPMLDKLQAQLSVADPPMFLVDDEEQPESEMRRLYYDWVGVHTIDPEARSPTFVFNSGQWVGTPGVLSREDFEPWVDGGFPQKQRYPDFFRNGEQGILNYLLNQGQVANRFRVERLPLMRWPGHGMEGFSLEDIRTGLAPGRIIHWAGMKRWRFAEMEGADILNHFEKLYYAQIPGGWWRRHGRAFISILREWIHQARTRVRLFWSHKIRCGNI
jgi:hypothetical protein